MNIICNKNLANESITKDKWSQAMALENDDASLGHRGTTAPRRKWIFFLTMMKSRIYKKSLVFLNWSQIYTPNTTSISSRYVVTTIGRSCHTREILWNSFVSTFLAKYACADIESLYLNAPMQQFEYMPMTSNSSPNSSSMSTEK